MEAEIHVYHSALKVFFDLNLIQAAAGPTGRSTFLSFCLERKKNMMKQKMKQSKASCVLCIQRFLVKICKLPQGAHGVVVPHPLRMRKALGSIPSVSMAAVK